MSTLDRRLLILDDEPEVGRIIGLIAEGAGFEWRSTTHPDQFFRELDSWSPTHLAIDLVMPEMDGVQVMRQLSQRGCTCRMVITSGVGSRVMDAAMRSGVEHGLDVRGVVPKPFSALTLRVLLLDEPDDWPVESQGKESAQGAQLTKPRDLEHAVKNKLFNMVYQPKVNSATGELSGFEALVHIDGDVLQADTPSNLSDKLEDNKLADEFNRLAFERSVQWFGASFSKSDTTLAISVSAQRLLDSVFIDALVEMCATYNVASERIILELSEATAMQEPARSLAMLTRLRMKGFALSLDDFGTGYSSMVQLVRLPFSEIKVDASFVQNASGSDEAQAIVKSIIDLGHSLKLKVTAEGVEDSAAAELLKTLGCDLLQGGFIGTPMDGEEILQWLADRH